MTTVTRDDDRQNIYTGPVGWFNELTSVDESKYEEKRQNELICPDGSISKKEPSKISEKYNALIHCYWCTYLILSTRQSEFCKLVTTVTRDDDS